MVPEEIVRYAVETAGTEAASLEAWEPPDRLGALSHAALAAVETGLRAALDLE